MKLIRNSLLALSIMTAGVFIAIAGPASADSPSDPRAQFFPGNATTCADIGLGSSIETTGDSNVQATVSAHQPEGEELNVVLGPNVVIDGILVKGGNGYNVYSSAVSSMIAPLNGGGNIPGISHYVICYHLGQTTQQTPPTQETPPTQQSTPTQVAPATAQQPTRTVTAQPRFTG
jgi:hypothetical protein